MEESESTQCELCTENDAAHICSICKASVCSECFNSKASMCHSCEEAKCSICGNYLSARACSSCGRLVCEDHGLKIGEATFCDICRANEQ